MSGQVIPSDHVHSSIEITMVKSREYVKKAQMILFMAILIIDILVKMKNWSKKRKKIKLG